MFGSETLEIGIGIIFVFILVSIICSAVREGIEGWLKTRAAHLEHGIRELLHDKGGVGLAKSLYNHPLIFGLFSGDYRKCGSGRRPGMFARGGDLPSYVPANNFATVLMDIAARGPATDANVDPSSPISLDSIRSNLSKIQNPHVQRVLLTALDSAQGDLNKVKESLEAWYNSAMDRVSGGYKRSTQKFIFLIGLVVAVAMNINPIAISEYLYHNDAARSALVASAAAVKDNPDFVNSNFNTIKGEIDKLHLPIGWTAEAKAPWMTPESSDWWKGGASPFLGWLLTALATTLGAPFWFDVLNKVMVIRSTVKPHEKSLEEASEDRQKPERPTAEVTFKVQDSTGATGNPNLSTTSVAA